MKRLLFALAAGAAAGAAALGAPESDVEKYVWDLSPLYADDEAWEAERAAIERGLERVGRLRGTLGRDAKSLAEGLEDIASLRRRAARMAVYGDLVSAVDGRSEKARVRDEAGGAVEAQVEAAVGFAAEEIRSLGRERLEEWRRREPHLERHWRRINQILWEAPHTPGTEAQAALQTMKRWPELSWDTYWAMTEADIGWPTIRGAGGEEVAVVHSSYGRLRVSANVAERNAANAVYLGKLRSLENVLGLLFARRVEADLAIARERKFSDGIEAIFYLRDGMPPGSARRMIGAARAGLPAAHRYLEARRRALGLETMTYGDLWAPPPSGSRRFTVEESIEIAIAASAPLGPNYQARLRERLRKPWMHLAPSPGKRGIYGIYPPVGGVPPYTVMSYRGDFASSRAFAGAATLMMSFADIPPDRMPDDRYDPGIYSNAILYVGNILHDDYLIERANDPHERAAYLLAALDRLWGQFFRWAMVSELEASVQARVAKGAPPSGREVSQMYLELAREYCGHGRGAVQVDELFGAEWMNNQVSFLSYEQQFWPPAMAAACLITEGLRAGDPGARRAVHQVLGRGELDLTYPLLRQVGIDMASPEPYEAVVRRMKALLDELEALLARL